MLFEDKQRTFQGPKSYVESDWDYLDRSARIEARRIRALLNKWFSKYPADERGELRARFATSDRRDFQSATFELVLFAVFRSLDCAVEIHPELAGESTKRPDFLVTTPDNERAYVEAVLASEYSKEETAARTRVNVILNAIDGIDSPDFVLWIQTEGNPKSPPRGGVLANELKQWLSSLDVDEVARNVVERGLEGAPVRDWEHDDWRVGFKAIPKSPESRGRGQRPIGVMSGEVRLINAWQPIGDAIRKKGGRYGKLPHPLLVCVNAEALSVDRLDEIDALFGQEEHVFDADDLSAPPQVRRKRNGAWSGPNGPRCTRVSGAWIFHSMSPWNLASRRETLYFNPWAQSPLPRLFQTLNHARGDKSGVTLRVDGQSVGDLLGLAGVWPE